MGIIGRILDAIESIFQLVPADPAVDIGEPQGAREGAATEQIQPIVIQPTSESTENVPTIAPITPITDTLQPLDTLQPSTPSRPEPIAPQPTPSQPSKIKIILNIAEPIDGGKIRQPIQGVTVTPNCTTGIYTTDGNGNAYFEAMRPASAPQFTGYATTANYAAMLEKAGYRGGYIPIKVNATDPETITINFWMVKA